MKSQARGITSELYIFHFVYFLELFSYRHWVVQLLPGTPGYLAANSLRMDSLWVWNTKFWWANYQAIDNIVNMSHIVLNLPKFTFLPRNSFTVCGKRVFIPCLSRHASLLVVSGIFQCYVKSPITLDIHLCLICKPTWPLKKGVLPFLCWIWTPTCSAFMFNHSFSQINSFAEAPCMSMQWWGVSSTFLEFKFSSLLCSLVNSTVEFQVLRFINLPVPEDYPVQKVWFS